MSSDPALKKQILRQAVDDNLLTPRSPALPQVGSAASGRRTSRRAAPTWVPRLGGLALLALVGGAWVWFGSRPAPTAGDLGVVPRHAVAAREPSATERGRATGAGPEIDLSTRVDPSVFPLAIRRIAIDPGHGGEDDGTTTRLEGEWMTEKAITLDVALRLAEQLETSGFEPLLTRRSDRALSLRERAQLANRQRADLFISIHVNWIADRSVHGIETYFLGPSDDPEIEALARSKNQRSGYALADLRQLLAGVYAHVRQDESQRLAGRIQRALTGELASRAPQLQDRGVKRAPFVVLVATEMPAILAEVSCLSNAAEAKRLARPRYREHIATALRRGIERYAQDVHQTEEKES